MNSYERFAEVYDELMTDIPYTEYVEWIQTYAPAQNYKNLLDIGCGTATLAFLLHKAGYAVSGIDLSEEMLAIASARMEDEKITMPLYAMSMDELEGFSELDVAIIPIDSINYVKEQQNVVETLKGYLAVFVKADNYFLMYIRYIKWTIFFLTVHLHMMTAKFHMFGILSRVKNRILCTIK